jgi:hypothetical protein
VPPAQVDLAAHAAGLVDVPLPFPDAGFVGGDQALDLEIRREACAVPVRDAVAAQRLDYLVAQAAQREAIEVGRGHRHVPVGPVIEQAPRLKGAVVPDGDGERGDALVRPEQRVEAAAQPLARMHEGEPTSLRPPRVARSGRVEAVVVGAEHAAPPVIRCESGAGFARAAREPPRRRAASRHRSRGAR